MQLLAVGVGGAVGALLRYALRELMPPLADGRIPFATLAANVAGSFLLGFLAGVMLQRASVSAEIRLGLTVGLLGAFTTFSAFSADTILLVEQGRLGSAAAYVFGSVATCLLAAAVGYRVAGVLT